MSNPRHIITFINTAHAIDHMFMLIFPTAILGMNNALDKSYGELLTLSLGGFIAFGVGSIPFGWLGDKWNKRNLMAIFFIGIGISAIITGFARSSTELVIGLTLIGFFASIYHPVGTAMLTDYADHLGRAIGYNGVWGNLGVAFSAVITGALTQWYGWNLAFILPGVIAIVVGIFYIILVPHSVATRDISIKKAVDLPSTVLIQAFSVLAIASIFGSILFNAITISMPKIFEDQLVSIVSSPLGIGSLVCGIYILGATSQIIVGNLLDRFPLRSIFIPLSVLLAPSLFLATFVQDWFFLILAVVMVFAIFGQITINDNIVASYTNSEWRSRAYAIRYFISFGASGFAVPMIAYIYDTTGNFDVALKLLALFGLIVFISAMFFPHRKSNMTSHLNKSKQLTN